MGMASSDDDGKIIAEHYLMEKIKAMTPEYDYVTCNMNEDMKIIYDDALKHKFLGTGAYAPKVEQSYPSHPQSYEARKAKGIPSRYSNYEVPKSEKEDEDDKKIASLKKKIEIAKLEKELRELTGK